MSSIATLKRRHLVAACLFALFALMAAMLSPAITSAANAAPSNNTKHVYIVMTTQQPLASYTGGVPGIRATKPARGDKFRGRTTNARAYKAFLVNRHNAVLKRIGVSRSAKQLDYTVAFNGFAAKLTTAQAAQLAKTPGVGYVWKNEVRHADTVSTPKFLGLDGTNGAWQTQFGGPANAGRGVIVGDIDTGFWPENPAFAPLSSTPDQATINSKWHGTCVTGSDPSPANNVTCNNKVIGARYYTTDNTINSFEFQSPRDYNGHGSHTASTAAGDHGVPASINGTPLGDMSGMAPAARIAVYKALWAKPDGTASGSTTGLVQAIDDSVNDGVDVINYSISGSTQYIVSPDEIAFLGAADAGVFVSASAGNDGPGASTVAHDAPWEMTVAASTHDRGTRNSVKLGDGSSYPGIGVSDTGVGPAPLVNSPAAAAAGASADAALLCFSKGTNGGTAALDPAKVTGKIVICTRGSNARVDKSLAVQEAGGVGMVLANTSDGQSLNADFHSVPTSHVNGTNGAAIKTYAATAASPTATITPRDPTPVRAPEMAGFSSAGPALAGGGDLLKPDITAPGVDVIAAVSPAGNGGNNFGDESGTSMSAPHVAGVAALLRSRHPGWSPMWVKSALMTTASPLDNTGQPIQRSGNPATPLDYGNGHLTPKPSFDPGLVYSNGTNDWFAYGCAIGQFQLITNPSFCASTPKIDPSDLNYPSIAVAGLAGSQTITRTVTNTSTDQASQYMPSLQVPAGFTASVNVSKLTIPPLQSRSFKVTFNRTTAPLGQWAFGSLTWTDKRGHSVRSSIALQPVAAAAPTEVTGHGTSGSQQVSVRVGYTGVLNAPVAGLVPARVDTVTVPKTQSANVTVTVPADTKFVRFATYDADYPAGTDVDIAVTKGGAAVGSSGGATAEESVSLDNPAAGDYVVKVTYFAGATPTLPINLNSFILGSAAAGNLTATPASQSVTSGSTVPVTLAWTGLTAGTRYLGAVNWNDGTNPVARTLVSVLP